MGVRGPKKHMKRMYAPKHWMLDKLTGVWAPRPTAGPHKIRECMPLVILLRNRLKYALTYTEAKMIVKGRMVQVDGKVRTDMCYPSGLMDVVTLEKTKENFRLLWDTKGRFVIHKIHKDEATYKLCQVKNLKVGPKGCPFIVTHDSRTIRFPDPEIKIHDTVRVDIETGKIIDYIKFEPGVMLMTIRGNNIGRIGTLMHRERHPGSFEIVHLKDAAGHHFATRLDNVMPVGKDQKAWISLPKGNGIKLSIVEDRQKRLESLGK